MCVRVAVNVTLVTAQHPDQQAEWQQGDNAGPCHDVDPVCRFHVAGTFFERQ